MLSKFRVIKNLKLKATDSRGETTTVFLEFLLLKMNYLCVLKKISPQNDICQFIFQKTRPPGSFKKLKFKVKFSYLLKVKVDEN